VGFELRRLHNIYRKENKVIDEEARKIAEEHWYYTEQVILLLLKLTERLYKDAMIHGIKHGEADRATH